MIGENGCERVTVQDGVRSSKVGLEVDKVMRRLRGLISSILGLVYLGGNSTILNATCLFILELIGLTRHQGNRSLDAPVDLRMPNS